MKENMSLYTPKQESENDNELNAERHTELAAGTQLIAQEVNKELGQKLLADDGCVSMKAYGFDQDTRERHRQYMRTKENKWMVEYYNLTDASQISTKMRSDWEKKQQERRSELMEMVTMIILNKILKKDEYIICRAARYDDYRGVDNILVNKKTGAVLCAFDAVHGSDDGFYQKEKRDELIKSAKGGGSEITYGFTFAEGQLVKKAIKNVPRFYVGFNYEQLEHALKTVNARDTNSVSEDEYKTFSFIMESFAKEIDTLKENGKGNTNYLKNLETFESLAAHLPEYKKAA